MFKNLYGSIILFTDRWTLLLNPLLGRQRIADKPWLDRRSYEVEQLELVDSPGISSQGVDGSRSDDTVHFSDWVHIFFIWVLSVYMFNRPGVAGAVL